MYIQGTFSCAAEQSERALPTTPALVKLSTLALCLRTSIWNRSSSRQKGREPARLHDTFLLASPERLEAPPFAPLRAGARQNKQEGLCRQLRLGGPTAQSSESWGSPGFCHSPKGDTPQAFRHLSPQKPEDASQRVSGRQKQQPMELECGRGNRKPQLRAQQMLRPNRKTVLEQQ